MMCCLAAAPSAAPLPIGKSTLLAVLVPALIPVLIVVSLQVPIGQLLLQILKAVS